MCLQNFLGTNRHPFPMDCPRNLISYYHLFRLLRSLEGAIDHIVIDWSHGGGRNTKSVGTNGLPWALRPDSDLPLPAGTNNEPPTGSLVVRHCRLHASGYPGSRRGHSSPQRSLHSECPQRPPKPHFLAWSFPIFVDTASVILNLLALDIVLFFASTLFHIENLLKGEISQGFVKAGECITSVAWGWLSGFLDSSKNLLWFQVDVERSVTDLLDRSEYSCNSS